LKELKVSHIRIDGGTQIRKQLNSDKVNEYAEQMNDGIVFPPITVFFDGSSYWLASGFHRLFAEKQRGTEIVKANVINGTVDEATWFALGDNKHGLNMNAEDYRRSIEIALNHPKWSTYSNIQIANHVGVSATTVARVKKERNIKPADKVKYTDKHGNEATMDTSKIGKKPAKPKPEPKAEPEEEQDEYDPAEEKMRELMDTITHLSDENTVLKDKIAIGQWDASEIEKIDAQETIENLREQVRILEIDNQALRESRDMFQNRNAELIKTVNSLKKKLQKGA
jgi:ParB-like chromosome segregation protein Spo0J